jgi:hypothetical protein
MIFPASTAPPRRSGGWPACFPSLYGRMLSFRALCAIIERIVGDKHPRYIAVGLGYSPKRRLQNWFDLFVLLDEVIVTGNK